MLPQIDGGGQERLLRSGTLPTPLIVGFSEAMYKANINLNNNISKLKFLRDRLHNHFIEFDKNIKLNGTDINKNRLPNNLNYFVNPLFALLIFSFFASSIKCSITLIPFPLFLKSS